MARQTMRKQVLDNFYVATCNKYFNLIGQYQSLYLIELLHDLDAAQLELETEP